MTRPFSIGLALGGTALAFALVAGSLALPRVPLAAPSPSASEEAARQTLRESLDRVLEILRNRELGHEERQHRIEAIAYDRFDFDVMARLVLARNLQKLSVEQRKEFVEEFKRHLGTTYGRRLETFSDEQLEIGSARLETNGDVTVKTQVKGGAAGDGVSIDYRMKNRNDSWYVIDVTIEGVSLIQNFRSQVKEIVNSQGVDRLIALLREKNDRAEAAATP